MLISLIISTYNRPDALAAVLDGIRRQSDRNFEILIADDGSGDDTGELLHRLQGQIGAPLLRIWHPDRGFRLAAIRNRAIAKARGDYIIFLDGDCIPQTGFIAHHRRLAERGTYVFSTRIRLSRNFTQLVLTRQFDMPAMSLASLAKHRMKGRIDHLRPVLPLPLGPFRKQPGKNWRKLRGGNFSAWAEDLKRVDGFDGTYVGWGLEDADLAVRLSHAGLRPKDGRFGAGVFHLWHEPRKRTDMGENLRHLQTVISGRTVTAQKGLSTLTRQSAPPRAPDTAHAPDHEQQAASKTQAPTAPADENDDDNNTPTQR